MKHSLNHKFLFFLPMRRMTFHRIFIFSMLFVLSCSTSKPWKVNDNKIEKPLEEVTGVTDPQLKMAVEKVNSFKKEASVEGSSDLGLHSLEEKQKLTLNDLFAFGVERTERLAIKHEKVIQAEAERNQAKGSWFPTLSYRYTKYQSIPDHAEHDKKIREREQMASLLTKNPDLWPKTGWPVTSSGSNLPPTVAGGSRLVLHIPIVTGLNEYAGLKASGKLIEQRKHELAHDSGRYYLEVAQLYFSIIQLEREIKSKTDIINLSLRTVNQLRQFLALGRIKNTDLLSAKTALAKSEAELEMAKANLQKARSDLSTLTGVPAESFISHEFNFPDPAYSIREAETFITKRADILAARLNMEVALASLKAAWGGYLPQVFIDNYYTLPTHNSTSSTPKDITALLTFQFPLISGVTKGQVDEAKSKVREAELNYKLTQRQAIQEIRQAYDTWISSKKEAIAYKKALDAAEENYKTQASYYYRHLGTIIDLITSLSNLSQSRNDYDHAMLQEKLNRIWVGVAVREFPKLKSNIEQSLSK